jgi:hypothetical protein
MNTSQERLSSLLVAFYPWISTVFFGAVWLDILYANLLSESTSSVDMSAVFSEISDTLLMIGVLVVLAAFLAIATAWKTAIARYLLIASLFFFSLELIVPILFSLFSKGIDDMSISPWVRLLPSGVASVWAMVGLHIYYRH